MIVSAPAKINLYLRVVGRRPDGYHEIETIFQTIALADTLAFTLSALCSPLSAGREILLECDDPSLPTDEKNLIIRAARALIATEQLTNEEQRACAQRTSIRLQKRIPVAGGLGGGSSNAAATLLALRRLWNLEIPDEALHALAAELGSDVPFFLRGGAALATGRGEILTPLPDPPPLSLVLVVPRFGVGTPWAYSAWRPVTDGPSVEECRAALATGDRDALGATLRNDLEPGVFAAHPELAAMRERLLAAGAAAARMTGSGSTLFALARDPDHARRIAAAVSDLPATVLVTETIAGERALTPRPPLPITGEGEFPCTSGHPSPSIGREGPEVKAALPLGSAGEGRSTWGPVR
jgi:4-diphosphocytidyl-2-C-methyl-D-erythritol kinase